MAVCLVCGVPVGGVHDEDCTAADHERALAFDPEALASHDPENCLLCLWP